VGSRPDFFITSVIDASLKPAGERPDARERLKSSATNGAITSEVRFMTYVGTGSAAEHLSGSGIADALYKSTFYLLTY